MTRGLGRYEIPVYRLSRLGVDRSVQGRGLGGRLLLRAAERCMTVAQEVGGVALLIDAKSDHAAEWYESYGAARLLDAPLSLVLPFSMAIKALKNGCGFLPQPRAAPLSCRVGLRRHHDDNHGGAWPRNP